MGIVSQHLLFSPKLFTITIAVGSLCTDWPRLEGLLADYAGVFDEGMTLPPHGDYDRKIELKKGANAVNIRPYRYVSVQKDEIEKMMKEMLEVGVIRPSKSPFTSPIVLVKKKDGT